MTLKLPFSLDEQNRRSYYAPDPTMLPKVDWRPPRMSELPSWASAKRVCIDVETRDETLRELGPGCRRDPNRYYVCGLSFAIEDGPAFYLPMRHEGGDNMVEGPTAVWSYVRDQMRVFKGTLLGNGITYDLDWICQSTGEDECLKKPIVDIQAADVMINELELQYDLDTLCHRHGLPGKDEKLLREVAAIYRLDPKRDMWRMPARFVAAYGIGDVVRPLQIYRRQETKIDEEGTNSIWSLEQKVTPILVKMRRRGIRIDLEKLTYIENRATEVMREEMAKVTHITGVKLTVDDVWKGDSLAKALRVAGYELTKTAKGKDSVDKEFLAKCGPIGKSMLRARQWGKLKTTFAAQVREQLIGDRAHVTFHQLRNNSDERDGDGKGVRYGRFSGTDFNIQFQPIRNKEFGALWRSIFVADHDGEWVTSDWGQQEPRIAVHYAEKLRLPGAKEFADEYRQNPLLDIHSKLAEISGLERTVVKNYVNGRLYGEGDTKLCVQLGEPLVERPTPGKQCRFCGGFGHKCVPGPEGQAKIDQFVRFAPWVPGLVREATKAAEQNGHVWTILRRKCRFERGPDGKIWRAHKSFNRVGQGSAADQMKATLVAVDAAGIPIQAIVHDEFDYTRPRGDRSVSELVRQLQLETVKFSVPMRVDVEVGPSWGEIVKEEEAA